VQEQVAVRTTDVTAATANTIRSNGPSFPRRARLVLAQAAYAIQPPRNVEPPWQHRKGARATEPYLEDIWAGTWGESPKPRSDRCCGSACPG